MAVLIPSAGRASGGGSQAIDCLQAFEGELDYLYRTFRRQGVPAADVEDLAQDVFLVLWRRWAEFDQERPVRPWLGAIASHLAIRHLSRQRREVQRADADRPDDTPLPDDRLASSRARSLVTRALAELPDRHRVALTLHELDGMPVRELAAFWSVPLFTAYTRLRAARRAFSRIVARLQPKSPRGTAAFLSPGTLLAGAKVSSPVPPEVRVRIQDRVRALSLPPDPRWAAGDAGGPGLPPAKGEALPARAATGRLPPASTFVILGSAAAVVILAVSMAGFLEAGGSVGGGGAGPPPPQAPSPSESTLRSRGTAPPRLVAAAPPESRSDLLGRWSLDDTAESSTARDSSGHGRDCLVRGPGAAGVWVDGARGGALDLAGGGWLECPVPNQSDAPTSELTLAAWIAPGPSRPGVRAIASRARVRGHGEHFFFGLRDGRLRLYSTPWGVQIEHPLPRGSDPWMHVAFTHGQDGLVRLYAGGVEVARAPVNRRFRAQLIGPLRVGAGTRADQPGASGAPQLFRGAIDEVRIYQRALTSREVAALASRNFP